MFRSNNSIFSFRFTLYNATTNNGMDISNPTLLLLNKGDRSSRLLVPEYQKIFSFYFVHDVKLFQIRQVIEPFLYLLSTHSLLY